MNRRAKDLPSRRLMNLSLDLALKLLVSLQLFAQRLIFSALAALTWANNVVLLCRNSVPDAKDETEDKSKTDDSTMLANNSA